MLKAAFVPGRLGKDEFDLRVGQAFAARTHAELDAVTADIPGAPRLDGLPVPARRWPLAMAAVKSGGCLVMAFVLAYSGNMIDNSDPNGIGPGPGHGWTRLLLSLSLTFVAAALAILGHGLATSVEQRRSRKQLPPGPGPGGRALDAGLHGGTGHDLVPPDPRTDQTRTDLRTHISSPHRSRSWARRPGGARDTSGTGRHVTGRLRRQLDRSNVCRLQPRAEVPARPSPQAAPEMDGEPAPRRHLHLDHPGRARLHHRTHPVPI